MTESIKEYIKEYIEISSGPWVDVYFMNILAAVRRQEIGPDGGISIELLIERDVKDESNGHDSESTKPSDKIKTIDSKKTFGNKTTREKLIRFDLFRDDPHYHLPATNQAQLDIPRGSIEQSLAFAYHSLQTDLPNLLARADFPDVALGIKVDNMPAVLERIQEAVAQAPEPNETNRYELTPQLKKALGL